ncbi:Uncharacterized protein dnl_24130 [Desulfonema limicola]|uniref:Uncharacterized protein n=1 Tax=Desulfonema limicola TaxID=45656 RepID=A0A975B765_9BACT|nr:hypothetical protein [Desulfonema limicola]QTA80125.1 Uncharacterized protein dnl_24130 [Desulfonema limicola]
MNILKKITQTEYVRSAVAEKADLSAFKEQPSMRIMAGIGVIIFSYIIGWPAVSAFGALSVYLKEPKILLIGGPLIYGLSHLVFIFGMYLAGAKYTKIFMRWATRMAVERFMGESIREKA